MIQSTGWCNRCHHIRQFTSGGWCTICGNYSASANLQANHKSDKNIEAQVTDPMQLEIPFKDTINK